MRDEIIAIIIDAAIAVELEGERFGVTLEGLNPGLRRDVVGPIPAMNGDDVGGGCGGGDEAAADDVVGAVVRVELESEVGREERGESTGRRGISGDGAFAVGSGGIRRVDWGWG